MSGFYREQPIDPVKLLQDMIRINTANPPGNETELIQYVAAILHNAGLQPIVLGKDPNRANLIVRLKGKGEKAPFLMYGHADVVSADGRQWSEDPFSGAEKDGYIWGRGALDMKCGLAMMLAALLRIAKEGIVPSGDILFAIVSDEEADGEFGAKYLTEMHGDIFTGVKYAIGEFGGFSLHFAGKRFYPIMISEKQRCSLKATIRGPGGHGSIPVRGGAMAELSRILHVLDTRRLPVHITSPVKAMIEALAEHLSFPLGSVLRGLLNPVLSDRILDLLGTKGSFFEPLLHNTVNATIVRGGSTVNMIPSEITVEFDGRLLPGYRKEDLLEELKGLLGKDMEFEVTHYCPGPSDYDSGLFQVLADILKEKDSSGIPVPYVNCGVTDARYFSRLGIQTYGFTPMLLPADMNFIKLIHGENERIPVSALAFGTDAIYSLLLRAFMS